MNEILTYQEYRAAFEQRAAEIVRRLEAGETQARIASSYSITQQRVGQIAKKAGYRTRQRKAARKQSQEIIQQGACI